MNTFAKLFLSLAGLALWVLVGCGSDAAEVAPLVSTGIVASPVAPTPTLDPGVPTLPPPTPEITPRAQGETAVLQSETADPAASTSPTPAGPPTPTPSVAQRFTLGAEALVVGDYDTAETHFRAALQQQDALSEAQQREALQQLGVAYLRDARYGDAATVFNQLLDLAGDEAPPDVYFHLGRASAASGDHATALEAYETYLAAVPEMAAYVYPRMAESHLALDDRAAAVAAYEAALEGPAYRLKEVALRQTLAEYYLADANYSAAIAQYDAIHDLAQTENTRGLMTYLAGTAEILAGNDEAGYERYQFGVDNYPRAYESYLGLVELVKAEQPVDEYQRGVVDYFAAAYQPCIEALERALAGDAETPADAHLYLAWCYEALGNGEAALTALDAFAAAQPATAMLERARLLARAGDATTAADTYQTYFESYPQSEDAPAAVWQAAALAQQLGDAETAVARYVTFADTFPEHKDAPAALFRAGQLAQGLEEPAEDGLALWQRAAETYPDSESGAAAMVWLLRTLEDEEDVAAVADLAQASNATHYFALRARDIAAGRDPFTAAEDFVPPRDEDELQVEAEDWLRAWLELPEETAVGELAPEIAADPRFVVGQTLWQLGLWEEARWEMENLRADYADDALASYQLALAFRDMGLYRSSIGAAATLLALAGETELEAPAFIGRLSYPVYYAAQIVPLAEEYGYDPRLQFALVRQESLFESFARSGAAAQGLSQVIPDTGLWIAQRLQWPDYVNEDLYKPYVGLRFGAYYLAQQLEAFDGDVHAALSAYNAGPGNALRWYETAGGDIDAYVETVDFAETRAYIERIYAGFVLYRYLYE